MALETRMTPPEGVVVYTDTVQPVVLGSGKFTFIPTNKTIGLVPDQAGVERVLQKLLESGFEAKCIELMSEEAGFKFVDATGERRGIIGQLIRGLQRGQDRVNLVERYAKAMLEGEFVIAVQSKTRESIRSAVAAFLEGEGHSVYHFGPVMVERIGPWNKHLRNHQARVGPRLDAEL